MLTVYDLHCEYQTQPLGLDIRQPRLGWKLQADRRAVRQTAYQIVAASTEDDLQEERDLLWDSGRVESDESVHISYKGPQLQSHQRVWWKVRVWDEQAKVTFYSEPAWWEMGLLKPDDWIGQWIGSSVVGGPKTSAPCPFLRKSFVLEGHNSKARLVITALGLYECFINGQRVGEDVLAPGWTDYNQRVQYVTYDVGSMLQSGENVVGVILGDGWYCGHVGNVPRQFYGDRPRLLAQLVVDYADGTTETIATDNTWRTTTGPLLESDLLMGESYDARLEMDGWNEPVFDDSGWQPVVVFDDVDVALVAKYAPPVRRIEELVPLEEPTPVRMNWGRNAWIFDLGQNMVGWIRLRVKGQAGTTIRLRYGEMLEADGSLYTANLRDARATDYYTLRGDVEEIYEPRFTFHGFRYVEVSGLDSVPSREMITGIVVHSDTPPTGTFECSDPLINQLQHNIVWGQKGNFLEVPTDCPQRDERLGWTGDAQIFIRTASFNMGVATFFTKWQQDLADAQSALGQIPPVAPKLDFGTDGGPAWADAFVICPWTIYQCYADERLLRTHYEAMRGFHAYLIRNTIGLVRCHPDTEFEEGGWVGFGDWLSLDSYTPHDLIGTAFLAHTTQLMSQIAEILGETEDATRFKQLAVDVRRAFVKRFVTADGLIVSQTQTAYVLALQFNLVPDNLRATVAKALVRNIEDTGGHLSTGFVGTPYLLHALTSAGYRDVAYELLHQTDYPSWLYPVTQGATTVWERWDSWTEEKGFQNPGMNSFNHYAYGAVGEWLYRVVAGIEIGHAGYKQIILRPRPGGQLTSVCATYESVHGRIVSDWRLSPDRRLDWQIEIPANTTARVYVPVSDGDIVLEGRQPATEALGVSLIGREADAAVYQVDSGIYQFVRTKA